MASRPNDLSHPAVIAVVMVGMGLLWLFAGWPGWAWFLGMLILGVAASLARIENMLRTR